jgi:hypothetical protein
MNMYNEASNGFGICVGGMPTETQIVGVICTGSVSEGVWAFVVVVVSCVVQKSAHFVKIKTMKTCRVELILS